MTPPPTLQFLGTKSQARCVYRGNIRIHYRSVIGGVMTPPYNVLQIISPLNYYFESVVSVLVRCFAR